MTLATDMRTACALAEEVAALIAQVRCDLTAEAYIQAEIERALVTQYGVEVSREHRLGPADRPDFLLFGKVVLEAKGKRHRGPAVLRQLQRYAEYRDVEAIVLATARAMPMPPALHRAGMGGVVPVYVVSLGRAWL